MAEQPTSDGRLPFGCHTGWWHSWQRWAPYASGQSTIIDLPSGKTFTTGLLLVQERECSRCGAKELRKLKT